MRWVLHGHIIEGTSNDATLRSSWEQSFAPLAQSEAPPDIRCHIDLVNQLPDPPAGKPVFEQQDLYSYYLSEEEIIVHVPDFGQLTLLLSSGSTSGIVVPRALGVYGLLEDIIAIALSPHLRRRGLYMIHAFAAAYEDRCALLVGHFGTGKTTAGLALLDAGWRLLSNDSPIVISGGDVLSYPGVVAAYPDTLDRFSKTRSLVKTNRFDNVAEKVEFSAESIWPDVWVEKARAGIILFPQVEPIDDHLLTPLDGVEALGDILPHTMERWDKTTISPHLSVVRELVESAPSYILRLGRDVKTLPAKILANMRFDS